MLDITGALGPEVPSFRAAGGENFEYHLRFGAGRPQSALLQRAAGGANFEHHWRFGAGRPQSAFLRSAPQAEKIEQHRRFGAAAGPKVPPSAPQAEKL